MRSSVCSICLVVIAACWGCATTSVEHVDGPSSSVLSGFDWLVGSWIEEREGTTKEEIWIVPRSDAMFGIARDVANGKTVFFEYLRIEHRPEGVFYIASPKGRYPPTAFKMIEPPTSTRTRAVFENPDHDFPKQITYWREGDTLYARIAGDRKGVRSQQDLAWRLAD
ncbi:MAG: hypothetical protein JSU63_13240 [Phycisphaerales bacterium]|nr:MAG: hypothetical protein JSU63_13240 [Phycisphaerales bacterium]